MHMSLVAHQVGSHSGLCSINYPPPPSPPPLDGMLVHRIVTCPSILYLPVLIYPPELKETVTVTCLAQEHNIMFSTKARGLTAQPKKKKKSK